MNKIKKILAVLLFLIGLPFYVYADDGFDYRSDASKGKMIDINGNKVHASLEVKFNIDSNGNAEVREFLENYDLTYANGVFLATIKRSELNKLFQNKSYDNVSNQISLWIDYISIDKSKIYYYFSQNNFEKPELYMNKATEDMTYNKYGIIELLSDGVELSGTKNTARSASGGQLILFEASSEPEYESYPAKYAMDAIDLTKDKILFNFETRSFSTQIVEDVQMDLGDVKTVVKEPTVNSETGEAVYDNRVEVNNYYAEYIDDNKLSYSWTMYDTNGNPVELKNDTVIKIDDEETEEEIYKFLSTEYNYHDDYSEHIKVLSFEHDGDLNGTAVIKIYVGDKFKSGEYLTLYYFNPDKYQLEHVNDELPDEELEKIWEAALDSYSIVVDDEGYVEIKLTHCSDYILVDNSAKEQILSTTTTDTSTSNNEVVSNKKNNFNKTYLIYIGCGTLLIIIIILTIVFIKKNKLKEKNNNIDSEKNNNTDLEKNDNKQIENINDNLNK